LDLSRAYVRGIIVTYLNRLIEIGVAGFRVDAAKHMWPGDLHAIYETLNDLNTAFGFSPNTRPFIFNEASHCISFCFSNIILLNVMAEAKCND